MHELAITREIVRIVVKESRKVNLRPKEIFIELGSLTTYKKTPLKYYYNILKKDSDITRGSSLRIKETAGSELKIKKIKGDEDLR